MSDFHGVRGVDYGIEREIDSQHGQSMQLSALLERVAELQAEKKRLEAEVSKVNGTLKEAEQLAVEQLAASGLDGVRAAGKSWGVREFFAVSIPEENKDKVLAAAKTACPEYIGVNTASLKSWLMERRRDSGKKDCDLADGTPFAGLISEFREMHLWHRTLG
jgi:uncharacterized small protein (DUF1192 family)